LEQEKKPKKIVDKKISLRKEKFFISGCSSFIDTIGSF
jgi:hypothetical protein